MSAALNPWRLTVAPMLDGTRNLVFVRLSDLACAIGVQIGVARWSPVHTMWHMADL
jgi:hypothetical protein